jgi:hypothetical protein
MKPNSKRCGGHGIGARALVGVLAATMIAGPRNYAWAQCADGTQFPPGGYVVGLPPLQRGAGNWSPNVFTDTAGSLWVPDNSFVENNDVGLPLTGGGHNWVFDRASTLCKVTDKGEPGALSTAWSIPPNSAERCVILPNIKSGRVTNFGDVPGQGDVITPTCNPAILSTETAPNPGNTYFNQLGCSISHGKPTDEHTAASFLFVPGIRGGLFSVALENSSLLVVGGSAGKTAGPQNYYSDIPEGQLLTDASVSREGKFVIAISERRKPYVYGCIHPLGNPGDPLKPINPNFFIPPANQVKCMIVGKNGLAVNQSIAFGPDGQPYFGGQRGVNSFNTVPGGNSPSAWPNCIWQNNASTSLEDAFNNHRENGCGNAQPNFGFSSALVTQPQTLTWHRSTDYMYAGPVGDAVVQIKVTVDPVSGLSQYKFRTYLSGVSIITGLGVAEDLKSLVVYTDLSAVGQAGQEVITKLPLCEDVQ